MLKTAYTSKEQLKDLLAQADLSDQAELIAMHLTEIEQETANFLDQLIAFRAHARQGDSAAAQESLVEISLALQHITDHIQTVTPLMDKELDIDDKSE